MPLLTSNLTDEISEMGLDSAALTISDCSRPDFPLVYVNAVFEMLTGYSSEEALGRNCRFLQGGDTDPRSTSRIRVALQANEALLIDIVNYRKDGSAFWNRLSLRPIVNAAGTTTHFVGIQSDITQMRGLVDRVETRLLER